MDTYWKNKVIWITGASTGIGYALTHQLLEKGAIVIGSARNEKKLSMVSQHQNYHKQTANITNPKQLISVANYIQKHFGKLDILISNAGTCKYINLPDFDVDAIEQVMQTNYMGTVYTIQAALPLLNHSNTPYIVGMASSNAYIGLPRSQAYGPSKAAIYNLMQSMKADLKGKIDISVICPGFVSTPLTKKNDFYMPSEISANKAAKIILKQVQSKVFEIHFPKRFTLVIKLLSLLPDSVLFYLTNKLSRKTYE